uniref:Uncharacterized protein n=1 Tax=Anguilla anguilla TaxID=7936 RepID=A0A0E9VGL2_ANGAN
MGEARVCEGRCKSNTRPLSAVLKYVGEVPHLLFIYSVLINK